MEIISLTNKYSAPICLALGFFDGIHLGHKALIEKAKGQAQASQSLLGVLTFTDNPFVLLKRNEKLIYTFAERTEILKSLGVDCVVAVPFDKDFMQIDRDAFLSCLCTSFVLRGIVCGYDYRFGKNARGDAQYLRQFCAQNHIMCDIVSPVCINDVRVSSSMIRDFVCNGNMEQATRLLGRPYFITGRVCHGRGVGKSFGFPTANIAYEQDKLLPACGVYATYAFADGIKYKSVTNVGAKPTFGEESVTVEPMLIDFTGDLYGKTVTVEFVRRLRDIKKYESPLALKEQIQLDAQWR